MIKFSFAFALLASVLLKSGFLLGQSNSLILLSNWDNNNLPIYYNLAYNEVFGWHDGNGREYAILGSMQYTYFIEVTNPSAPVVRDSVPGTYGQCIHRDFKTYGHYCYGVADEGTSSLQIIDMSYLPDSVHLVRNSTQFFSRAHNVFIDTTAGKLYACGTNTQNGGIIVLNLAANPENPTLLASVNLGSYTHDLSVRGDTAYMNNGYDGFRIMSFANPLVPVMLATLTSYPQSGYNHSNWLTADANYMVMCDETRNKSCKIVDLNDFNNLHVTSMFRSALLAPADTASIPHNPHVIGNYAVVAYYHDGVQMWDISNRAAPVHVAGYDTYPNNTNYLDWYGAWGAYPYLPSGTILGSDVLNGLFVFRVPFPFPTPLTATSSTQAATCSYSANGHATVTGHGGTGPYTYLWSSGQTTSTITNGVPGTYTVTVSDRYGYNIVQTVTIPGPTAVQFNPQVAAESCEGTADGAIDLSPTGGTPGYSYLWNTGDMVQDLNGLTAGTYSVVVTDAAGCVFYDTISVSFLQPTPASYAGNDTVICNRNVQLGAAAPSQGQAHWDWVSGSGNILNPTDNNTWLQNLQLGQNELVWIVTDGQCSGLDTVVIHVSSTAFILAGEDTMTCTSNVQLGASSPGNGFGNWTALPATVSFSNVGDPNATAGGLQPGWYTLYWTIHDGNCIATDSISILVSRPPFAAFSYTANQLSVAFQDMSQYAMGWSWDFGDGGSSLAQNPTYTYATPGVYNVCLTVHDTCGTNTSCQALNVTSTGITQIQNPKISAWPNPFGGSLVLSVSGTNAGAAKCRLLDLHGRKLWEKPIDLLSGSGEYRLELPHLPSGVYFLEVQSEDWSKVLQVVRGN